MGGKAPALYGLEGQDCLWPTLREPFLDSLARLHERCGQDIARNCDPPIQLIVAPIGTVVVVTVRESGAKPMQCSDGFFWRQGLVNIEAA